MEADGLANTKTLECTDGTATAVQAMYGDSCTARKVQDGPKTSTSFGGKAEPPDLLCRENVLVENGAASPKSCLPSLEMRSPTAVGGLLPTREVSTATKTTYNKTPLRLYATEETNPKPKKEGLQFYPTDAIAGFGNCLLPPPAGESIKQNPGKIGRSIQAVFKVVSAPAHLWDRGARCFVWRFMLGLDETGAFFGGSMIRDSKAFRKAVRAKLRRAYIGQFAGSLKLDRLRKCCARKSHAVESGSRLQEGRREVTPSMAARGFRISGAIGCRGASWSEACREGTLWSVMRRARGALFSRYRLHIFFIYDSVVCCLLYYCEQKTNTPYLYNSVFVSRSVLSWMRIPTRSLPCSRRGCCSFREGGLCELVRLRQVFVRGRQYRL